MHTGFSWENLREEEYLENAGVDGGIMLKSIFEKWDGVHRLDRSDSGQRQVTGCFECGNEPLCSIK